MHLKLMGSILTSQSHRKERNTVLILTELLWEEGLQYPNSHTGRLSGFHS